MPGAVPAVGIEVTDLDPAWPRQYGHLAGRIRQTLGWRALQLEHVGSTAVPELAAKPVIGVDRKVAGLDCEWDYIPALKPIGFRLTGPRALVVRSPGFGGR